MVSNFETPCIFSEHFLQVIVAVFNDCSASKDSSFEPMQSDFEYDYSSSSNAGCGKKGKCLDLLWRVKRRSEIF